jgi:hypothetical protein
MIDENPNGTIISGSSTGLDSPTPSSGEKIARSFQTDG